MYHLVKSFCGLRWLLMLMVVSLSGCGGCRRGDNLSKEELEKRAKQKESLELGSLLTLPVDSQAKIATVKGGHWYESQQEFKSNREDMQIVAVGDLSRDNQAVSLPGTNMTNEYSRRTSLPKGQSKWVELQFFIPDAGTKSDDPFIDTPKKLNLRTQLRSWPLMTPILQTPQSQPTNELKRNEFQLVAVGPQALSYEFLAVLDAVRWVGDDLSEQARTRSYQVVLVKPENGKYAIPRSMLTMTATAVMVWDDVSLDEMDQDQQTAIVDWLHWGGQLIISGPSSWSRLQNSFLSKYLPATSADAAEFGTQDFKELSDKWHVPDRTKPNERAPLDIVGAPIGGLKFKLSEGGQWLPSTGELVAERQVGRGRVVVTGFPMREPRIFRWKYFSNFLSTGLLRRPPREIHVAEGVAVQSWDGRWGSFDQDPRLHSNFRIMSRDLSNSSEANPSDSNNVASRPTFNAKLSTDDSDLETMRWGGNSAAWNDYSGVAVQARTALRRAAGIELPDRWTIIYLISAYLLVLVPVNWLVFRVLGRLEYAWVAAPILALVAVGVVTRVARLDIGFARRNTEISLLELHGGHNRGHLTRYVALYTSLSTNYSVEFPESGSVVLPFGDINRNQRRAVADIRNLRTNFGTSSGVVLEPLTVYSNSTEMLHAEQMVALGGGISLEPTSDGKDWKLMNASELELKAAVILRNEGKSLSYAWLDEVEGKTAKAIRFEPMSEETLMGHWKGRPETWVPEKANELPIEESESLWVGGVLAELLRKSPLVPGQTRLFAYTDSRPGELSIVPKEDQFEGRCVVVAHLTPSQLTSIRPDVEISSPSLTAPEVKPDDPDAQIPDPLGNF
jgi:hypothetical protein